MAGPEDEIHVGSNVEGSQDVGSYDGDVVGCFEGTMSNAGSEPSSSALRQQRRQPEHKRQQQ